MILKLEQLNLNDSQTAIRNLNRAKQPSDREVCDDVVLLWREEPASEELEIEQLFDKLKLRNCHWDLELRDFCSILTKHNLYATENRPMFTYADKVRSTETPDLNLNSKIELRNTKQMGKGLVAKSDLKFGELVFSEKWPLILVPQLEKKTLAAKGRCCSLCGASLTQSSHFTVINGLDCSGCSSVWCSKHCKKADITHNFLNHQTSKNTQIDAKGWREYEEFCRSNSADIAYSVGVMFARFLTDRQNGPRLKNQFASLAGVSQLLRMKALDSINVGGTFDASTGPEFLPDSSKWSTCFDLFCQAFPTASSEGITQESFLTDIGKFHINQVSGQIYTIFSHVNHSCEPNVRYEIDPHWGLKVYARKPITIGEELFVSYVNPLHGLMLRRRELRVNWGFICNCPRCLKEVESRNKTKIKPASITTEEEIEPSRRRSSLKTARPDLSDLLKNGVEFDLEIPNEQGLPSRRKSVRFDKKVMVAVEE
ncbi:LAMI_0C03334g1_1 [Lachancea mirantina]|uniref:Histone-lysine N-methyltransferase SET5 n=1 Tax=Lachancea mirantina TaxID=1230905 RepID=A0A1G4J1U4_9SACH|nr:LAMI_0C03334g1_1 [Lachancea mirantina]